METLTGPDAQEAAILSERRGVNTISDQCRQLTAY